MTQKLNSRTYPRGATALCGTTLLAGLLLSGTASADEVLADLIEELGPTVVTVIASREIAPEMPAAEKFSYGDREPFQDLFRRFGPPNKMPDGTNPSVPRTGLGSGFILEADGLIVTNYHVIDDATEITVRLSDGSEFEAEIIGMDPQTDLALLSVDVDEDLPVAVLGDSDEIRVGEDVVAIGNPFGLGGTVTSGIVSAKGRDLSTGPYAEFLQTDAAINKGNSGGPLFNMDGEVVGVNTVIFSPSGGSVGVGFAVTSNIVELITDDLREDGRIDRGWLGVAIQNVTPDIAAAMGQEEHKGALVSEVISDGPADGIVEVGDLIIAFGEEEVSHSRDLPKLVAVAKVGETSKLRVIRDGKAKELQVKIGQHESARAEQALPVSAEVASAKALGVTVAALTQAARSELGLDENATGMLVTSLAPNGPAAKAGLETGDVIVKLGDEEVETLQSLKNALQSEKTDPALVLINRGGRSLFVAVEIA